MKKVRGTWTVQLNPAIVPKVRMNQVYAHLFQRHRTPQNTEMGAHLHEARWTLRNVEQRFSTILDVAQAIVRRQKNFLEYGAMAMKPLGLREIADIIEAEQGDKPLSDAEITRQLAQQGLVVARRTVTKYRQMLKIEAVDRRRRHAATV